MDSVYDFGEMRLAGHLCKTHMQSSTAFRGFGAPQSMFITESMFDHIAHELNVDVNEVEIVESPLAHKDKSCSFVLQTSMHVTRSV